LKVEDFLKVFLKNLPFETEEQTLSLVLNEALQIISHGLLEDDQIVKLFETVSAMELTCGENVQKAALINKFCSEVTATGLIIPPESITPEICYEVIG
jgi:hypothetical protein